MWDTTMNEKGEETIMAFVHLHTHTEYSLLDGSNKIKEYVSRVKELGMNSAAITDHGNMYGVVEFYKTAKAADINPVIGCEIYVAPNSRFDRETSHGEDRYYHLILLAENNTGYANLMKIVSIGFTEGYYYRPRVDFETLQKYHEGLICLSACLAGEVPRYIVRGFYEEAKGIAKNTRTVLEKTTISWNYRIMASRIRRRSTRGFFGSVRNWIFPLSARTISITPMKRMWRHTMSFSVSRPVKRLRMKTVCVTRADSFS